MSKQSDAKTAQGYVPKAIPKTCMTCVHFSSRLEKIPYSYGGGMWTKETDMRCMVGGFAVKKMGTCTIHVYKE